MCWFHHWTPWEWVELKASFTENAREQRRCLKCGSQQWRYLRLGHEF